MRVRRTISWIVVLLVGACVALGSEGSPSEFDYRHHPDVQRLIQTRYFGMGGFGLPMPRQADEPPEVLEGAALLHRILLREDAVRFLFPVFEDGTLEAKCYAMVGLHELAPEYFEKCTRRLARWSHKEVRVAAGCVVDNRPLGEIILEIRRGTFAARPRRR